MDSTLTDKEEMATRYDTNSQPTVPEAENAREDDYYQGLPETPKSLNNGAILAAGMAGVAAGVGGAILLSSYMPHSSSATVEEPTGTEPEQAFNLNAMKEATQISAGMSFSDAFAAARSECGNHGYFEWQGKMYNTYYAEEWAALTPEEKLAVATPPYEAQIDHGDTHFAEVSHSPDRVSEVAEMAETLDWVDENGVVHSQLPDGAPFNYMMTEIEGLDAVFLDGDNDYDFEVAIIENPDNPEEPLIFEHPDGVSIDEINEGYHLVDDSTEDSSTFASSDYDDWNVENLEDSSEDLRLDYYDDDMCF